MRRLILSSTSRCSQNAHRTDLYPTQSDTSFPSPSPNSTLKTLEAQPASVIKIFRALSQPQTVLSNLRMNPRPIRYQRQRRSLIQTREFRSSGREICPGLADAFSTKGVITHAVSAESCKRTVNLLQKQCKYPAHVLTRQQQFEPTKVKISAPVPRCPLACPRTYGQRKSLKIRPRHFCNSLPEGAVEHNPGQVRRGQGPRRQVFVAGVAQRTQPWESSAIRFTSPGGATEPKDDFRQSEESTKSEALHLFFTSV